MKAKIIILAAIFALIVVVFAVIPLIGFISFNNITEATTVTAEHVSIPSNTADSLRFKEEHEALNDILDEDGNLKHLNIYIPENNRVVYVSFDELMELIDYGTGVFFFSRPNCPWCRVLIPTLLQVAEDMGIYIHYYDIDYDRSAHNENYVRILEALHNYLPVDGRNQTPGDEDFDENLKRVTVPHLFFVVEGRIINEIMMNRHSLLVYEDFDGLYDFLSDMFLSVSQVINAPRSECQVC